MDEFKEIKTSVHATKFDCSWKSLSNILVTDNCSPIASQKLNITL
jgi:hypothetical protein